MTTIINASPSNGLVQTADGSGILKVQSNGVTTNALAWVNFNGITTTSIRSSYNVSSVTRNGTGDYTINFATALSDANYSWLTSVAPSYGADWLFANVNVTGAAATESAPTTTSCRMQLYGRSTAASDSKYVNIAVFGN